MNEELEEKLYREDIQLASTQKRAMALFIDELLLSLILIFSLSDAFANAQTVEAMIELSNTFMLEYMAIKIIYQTFFIVQYGATLGKIAMKIRVIEISTMQKPRLASAFNRAVFRIISEMLFYLGYLWGMFDPARQTWHDKTARTLVVDA